MTKEKTEKEPAKAADQDRRLPVPGIVYDVLSAELDSLDEQIQQASFTLTELNAKYEAISKFLKDNR